MKSKDFFFPTCEGADEVMWLFIGTVGALEAGGAAWFPNGTLIGGGTLVPLGGTFSIL